MLAPAASPSTPWTRACMASQTTWAFQLVASWKKAPRSRRWIRAAGAGRPGVVGQPRLGARGAGGSGRLDPAEVKAGRRCHAGRLPRPSPHGITHRSIGVGSHFEAVQEPEMQSVPKRPGLHAAPSAT